MAVYEYNSQNDELKRIAGGTLFSEMAIGTFVPFGGSSIPTGFLLCDGSAVSRTTYADLFAVIGTAFGSGDGSTTFNIPDMREATAKGAGLTSKSNNHLDADGLAVGEFIEDRVQEHNHNFQNAYAGTFSSLEMKAQGGDNSASVYMGTGATATATSLTSNTGRQGATTEVKSVGCNWIIKALSVGVPADFVSAIKKECCLYPDYSSPISIGASETSWTATEDVFCQYIYVGGAVANLTVDNNVVSVSDGANSVFTSQFSGFIRKGQIVSSSFQLDLSRTGIIKFFKLH